MTMWLDIEDFHNKFLPDVEKGEPGFLPDDVNHFRVNFMKEELNEFIEALEEKNLEKAFDGLIDLVYVAMGTAWLMNLPWDKGWAEVQRANMSKVRAENASQSKRGHQLDVIKPEGWRPPNLQQFLEKTDD